MKIIKIIWLLLVFLITLPVWFIFLFLSFFNVKFLGYFSDFMDYLDDNKIIPKF